MELEAKYEKILLEIYASEGQCFPRGEISVKEKLEEREIQLRLDFLVTKELVEFDKTDDAYYLTTEGYEQIEGVLALKEAGETMANMEFAHTLKKEKRYKVRLVFIGLLVFIGGCFALSGIKLSINPEVELNEEIFNNVREEIEFKVDSLIKEKRKEQLIEETHQ